MSFLKRIFRGDPAKSAAKHEKRARAYQKQGNERRAADEWAMVGRDYFQVPDLKRSHEAYLQAAQFYLAVGDAEKENEILQAAVDVAIAAEDFDAAANALIQMTRIGTRLKDDQLLLHAYALQTITLIAANDLAKAKETQREAVKVAKRLGPKTGKTPVYMVALAFFNRFIEGESIPEDLTLPTRFNESENINQLIINLLTLYNDTKKSSLKLNLDKDEVKIKDRVSGYCTFSFPIPVQIIETQLALPSNIALLKDFVFPDETKKRFKINFVIEPRLPGNFDVGPLSAVLQVGHQRFQLKSNIVPLQIIAAKPKIEISVQPSTSPRSQEEFELLLRIENKSHGDASEVNIIITLPPTLLLKTGTLEKRIITLPAQQHVQFPLFIIATKAGSIEGVIECKYKGPSGRSRKIEDKFSVEVLPRTLKEKD